MILSFFNYPGSDIGIKLCFHHYQSYYNSVEEDLKIDDASSIIEVISRSLESNMEYLCHYYVIDVNIFIFLSDSIVEAANYGLRRGDVIVSTNMNIDTSELTQIKVSRSQA